MGSRSLALLLGGSLALCAVAPGACIPHPADDFEGYTERTSPFRESTATDGGGVDSAPPTQAEEALYFGACLSKLAAGRIDRVLRFYTETKFTPDPAGGTGKLTLKLTPMKLGPGNAPPPNVSKAQTVGTTYTVTDTPTGPTGVYAAPIGTVNVPGASNPISGRDIVVEQAALPGKFGKGKFCSQLIGHVTTPTDIQLDGPDNTCIYIQVKEGDPTPVLKPDRSDFPETCTLQ
jgi:hypothetical protein